MMSARPRVLIVRAPGTNCDEETAVAWEAAGARPETWHIARILERPEVLPTFQVLTIPGGFSYGDDLGAGRILAARLDVLRDAVSAFRDRGGLVLGICNGFQILVRAGLLPGAIPATLARNENGRFEARWVRLRPTAGTSPFLSDAEPIELPVAHGEGRFLAASSSDGGANAWDRSGVVLTYVDESGQPTEDYPANPNGSPAGVAGVCDVTGRVFGLMPHPERAIDPRQHPRWTREEPRREGDGLRIFRNAVRALA